MAGLLFVLNQMAVIGSIRLVYGFRCWRALRDFWCLTKPSYRYSSVWAARGQLHFIYIFMVYSYKRIYMYILYLWCDLRFMQCIFNEMNANLLNTNVFIYWVYGKAWASRGKKWEREGKKNVQTRHFLWMKNSNALDLPYRWNMYTENANTKRQMPKAHAHRTLGRCARSKSFVFFLPQKSNTSIHEKFAINNG